MAVEVEPVFKCGLKKKTYSTDKSRSIFKMTEQKKNQ